jgi:hypothetical protein
MASHNAHRSSAISRSGHWEGAPLAQEDGGGSSEAHQWRNSAMELANQAGDEVMRWRSESRGEVTLGAWTRGEGDGMGCGLRQRLIWRPFYGPGSWEAGSKWEMVLRSLSAS